MSKQQQAQPSQDGPAKPHGDKLGAGNHPARKEDAPARSSGDSPKRHGDPLAETVRGGHK